MDIGTYQQLGLQISMADASVVPVINGRSNAEIVDALATPSDRQYNPCREASVVDGVPTGKVTAFHDWIGSKVFAGTKRELWIYVPPAFDPLGPPPSLLVCNDGGGYLAADGPVRATVVLDNLLYNSEIAPTIAVFVNPGRPLDVRSRRELAPGEADDLRATKQRSVEYDSCTDSYARFLIEDLLPFVEDQIGCSLTDDPSHRTVCGISSGGICAFTAAWYRPDVFGRVLSHCGSFTAIRGGHNYPYLIRSTPRKPIRVFLQSGETDADIVFGNWPLANKEVASALRFAGSDVKFVFGEGGHSLRHGGAVFADSLRWLWRISSADAPE